MRLQHRKDTTHDTCTEWLEKHGWLVFDVHNISGFVDAIAVKHGRVVFLEFKTPGTSKARIAKHAELHARLRAAGAEVLMVSGVPELALLVAKAGEDAA